MRFNLAILDEVRNAQWQLAYLADKNALVEIKKIGKRRSLNQNSYLHLLLAYVGQHFGYTIEEAKLLYKKMSPEIYRYRKHGHIFWRSSADLSVEDMTKTIEKLRQQSADAGLPLPTATDQGWLREIENEIERSKYYL